MEEQEMPFLHISEDDIHEANQLSLHCPICSSSVEAHLNGALTPVVCAKCGTLYHKTCWEQAGGKCAVLGCGHDTYRLHGQPTRPALKLSYSDLSAETASRNGSGPSQRTKRMKHEQRRQVEQLRRPGLFQRLWQWLLDQIQIN